MFEKLSESNAQGTNGRVGTPKREILMVERGLMDVDVLSPRLWYEHRGRAEGCTWGAASKTGDETWRGGA